MPIRMRFRLLHIASALVFVIIICQVLLFLQPLKQRSRAVKTLSDRNTHGKAFMARESLKRFVEQIYYTKDSSWISKGVGTLSKNLVDDRTTQSGIFTMYADEISSEDPSDQLKIDNMKPACNVPYLDPFDEAAMKHVKEVARLECPKKYFTSVKDRYLIANVDDVRAAYIEYVKRQEEDDDKITYSQQVPLLKGFEKKKLRQGAVGCIIDENNNTLSVESIEKVVRIVQRGRGNTISCKPTEMWYINPSGTIEQYVDNLCLQLNGSCVDDTSCDVTLTSCDKEAEKFYLEGGKLQNIRTKQFLGFNGERAFNGKPELVAVKTKENASRFALVEQGEQNLRVKHKLEEDFVKVTIVKNKKVHEEYHAVVVPNKDVINVTQNTKKGKLHYDVALLMIDSQSASNVKRKLKRVYDYISKDKNSFIFKGHSIVGDGTTAQLSALLAGAFEWDFPESRRGFDGGKPIDDWPFVFKNFTKQGYVTMFNEDEPVYGTFNYRLYGFKKQPTHHYMRPFWIGSKLDYYPGGICQGDNPIFTTSLEYLKDFHETYLDISKLSLTILSAMFHDDLNRLQNIEDELLKFIEGMTTNRSFDKTIFILFGDHGARFEGFRETMTGKLEERLPFVSIRLPTKLVDEYPEIAEAMNHNRKLLTSFFDIHATLQHLLTFPSYPKVNIGQSLFNKIDPSTRTCEAAGIKEHWCPCLQFAEKDTTDQEVVKLANSVVDFINVNITGKIPMAKLMCAKLRLDKIKRAGSRLPNEKVRKFQHTAQNSKCIECDIILDNNDSSKEKSIAYELVLSVLPSNAVFEAYVTVKNNITIVNSNLSRLDRYGDQPHCVQKYYPSLRKYCFCMGQSSATTHQ